MVSFWSFSPFKHRPCSVKIEFINFSFPFCQIHPRIPSNKPSIHLNVFFSSFFFACFNSFCVYSLFAVFSEVFHIFSAIVVKRGKFEFCLSIHLKQTNQYKDKRKCHFPLSFPVNSWRTFFFSSEELNNFCLQGFNGTVYCQWKHFVVFF